MLGEAMSLRPAQALVAESSRFSLRTFFETKALAQSMPAPQHQNHTLTNSPLGQYSSTAVATAAAEVQKPALGNVSGNKFTFTGLVAPTRTAGGGAGGGGDARLRLVAAGGPGVRSSCVDAAAVAISDASAQAEATAAASENLKLKGEMHTLQAKVAQLTGQLASTQDSVMRGNKALVAERAQFHVQYGTLSDKLKQAQVMLVAVKAAPMEVAEAAEKAELSLMAKIDALQVENAQLAASADASETLLQQNKEAVEKHTSLSAQHSVLLDQHENLKIDLEQRGLLLEKHIADNVALQARVDALLVEEASSNALVDTLDAKLATVRATDGCGCGGGAAAAEAELPPAEAAGAAREEESPADAAGAAGEEEAPVAEEKGGKPLDVALEVAPIAACQRTLRCEALQLAADEAERRVAACCVHEDAAVATEHHSHLAAVARRAWVALTSGHSEKAVAVHFRSDPMRTEAAPVVDLAQCISPTALQKGPGIHRHLLSCEVPCCTTGAYPDTSEGRTTAFVEAVSRDMKLSMDGSLAAYQNSMKTGSAIRV